MIHAILQQYDNNNLLIGWDNAPHHPDITTYPHHKHIHQQTRVFASVENDLPNVLEFIEKRILN